MLGKVFQAEALVVPQKTFEAISRSVATVARAAS